MNLLNNLIILIITALLLVGCVTSSIKPIDTKLEKLSIIKITPFGQSFKLWINVQNKSNQAIYLRTLDYKLSLNNIQVAAGREAIWRAIPAFSSHVFSINISANIWEQFKSIIATIKDTQKINYYFTGELMMGGLIFQERIYIQQADALTMDDLPLKKLQKLQHLIPKFSL